MSARPFYRRRTALAAISVLMITVATASDTRLLPPPASEYRLEDVQDASTRESIEGAAALKAEGIDPCLVDVEVGQLYCNYYCTAPSMRFAEENMEALEGGDEAAFVAWEALNNAVQACSATCKTRHARAACQSTAP